MLVIRILLFNVEKAKRSFQFDFAKVYWNPRLCMSFFYQKKRYLLYFSISATEHERIIDLLHPNDIVFDVCAGVGPFVVPASMLGCTVFANDINPECYRWMNINLKKNQPKKSPREYHVWNLDGREFLQTIAFPRIEQYQHESMNNSSRKIIMLMNLPALAVTFLDVFSTWLTENVEGKDQWTTPVQIYCYTFSREENREEDIRSRLATIIPNVNSEQISCRFVRQVAPNKDMMCVQITLFGKKPLTIEQNEVTNDTVKRFKADPSE